MPPPPGHQPPPHPGAQPPGGPGAPGNIEITVQGHVLLSNFVPPTVTIDGHKIQGVGVSAPVTVPVPPGRRHIEAYSQWLRRYGQASLDVDVRPGELVRVYYAPPLHQFATGNMGLERQEMKGLGCLIAVILFIVVAVLAVVLIPFLLS
ncbi:hypothetical protein [Enemella sp. A6]|uniref:hypothetical protein n=1 Tax=Enemella sp. A6 TaxID=3440152 RepID=UPI003EB6DF7E